MYPEELEIGRLARLPVGSWPRGKARVALIPRGEDDRFDFRARRASPAAGKDAVKVVEFAQVAEHQTPSGFRCRLPVADYYELAERSTAAAALRSLLAFGDRPSDGDLVAFVERYGPLCDFRAWLARLLVPGYSRDGARLEPSLVSSPPAYGALFDFADLLAWCVSTQDWPAADYVNQAAAALRSDAVHTPPLPEPVALYGWSARWLARTQGELGDAQVGQLADDVSVWLQSRLSEAHFLVGPKLTLKLIPSSLLARLTMQIVEEALGMQMEMRVCKGCGKVFPVEHGNMLYCNKRCEEAHKKRRYRLRARARKERERAEQARRGGSSDG